MNELTALTFGLQAFVTLLVILDPPGAAPLFLSLVGNKGATSSSKNGLVSCGHFLINHHDICALWSVHCGLPRDLNLCIARRWWLTFAFDFT
jgi:hypothetical protein